MKSITLLALIAGTAPAPPALAQNSDATRSARNDTPDPARRDDIVVTGRNFVVADSTTATKSDAPILSTPQAISVVDSDFIDTLNLRTVAEALNYTSGVRSQARRR